MPGSSCHPAAPHGPVTTALRPESPTAGKFRNRRWPCGGRWSPYCPAPVAIRLGRGAALCIGKDHARCMRPHLLGHPREARTDQSMPLSGSAVRNRRQSGGFPKITSLDAGRAIPASTPSAPWSITSKNLMPLVSISALIRMTVSSTEQALRVCFRPLPVRVRPSHDAG